MGHTEPGPWIGVDQAFVAGMHTRGDIFRLTSLVRTGKVAIERLENKCSQIEGIDCGVRGFLDCVPARSKLRRGILC